MTKEKMAALLDGREYREEMSGEEEEMAKSFGLIVIFGASDDLCELRGYINDEVGCYDGGEIYINRKGEMLQTIDSDDEEILEKYDVLKVARADLASAVKIEAVWGGAGYSWIYKTDTPHATFDIMEDDDKYCRGIVIDLKDL